MVFVKIYSPTKAKHAAPHVWDQFRYVWKLKKPGTEIGALVFYTDRAEKLAQMVDPGIVCCLGIVDADAVPEFMTSKFFENFSLNDTSVVVLFERRSDADVFAKLMLDAPGLAVSTPSGQA